VPSSLVLRTSSLSWGLMRTSPPSVLPIFRSPDQVFLLAAILRDPSRARPVTEWAKTTGVNLSTAAREILRAENAGLVKVEWIGATKLVSANANSPFFEPLQQLLIGAFGIPSVLAEALTGIPEIGKAYLFGSWAARLQGETGPLPNDIDVLVIGAGIDRNLVYDALEERTAQLPAPVQVVFRSPEAWKDTNDSFISTVRSRPLVPIDIPAPQAGTEAEA
jgi:predicted nucleotidyltransferase